MIERMGVEQMNGKKPLSSPWAADMQPSLPVALRILDKLLSAGML